MYTHYFIHVLIIQIDQYIIEKRMLNETETILKQDYYFLSTIESLQSQISHK